jgi:hypothetical protein
MLALLKFLISGPPRITSNIRKHTSSFAPSTVQFARTAATRVGPMDEDYLYKIAQSLAAPVIRCHK